MKKSTLLYFAAALLLMTACNNEQKAERAAIQEKETAVDENTNSETIQALLQSYQDYREQYPDDDEYNARYAYREAALQYRMNNYSRAAELLTSALRNYPSSEVRPRIAYMLGDIYSNKMRSPETAITIYQTMQKAFPEDSLSLKAQQELPEPIVAVTERLADMKTQIFSDSTGRIDYRQANTYVTSATLYAMLLPASADSPDLLYQAAEVARAIRDHNQSLQLYAMIYEQYPDHKHAPKALFMQAFTYDDNLKEFDKARTAYESFIRKYPNDDFADDAQVLLENLGKNDEEIIENLTKKGQQIESE